MSNLLWLYVKFNWGSGNKEFDERGTGGDSSLESLNSLPYSGGTKTSSCPLFLHFLNNPTAILEQNSKTDSLQNTQPVFAPNFYSPARRNLHKITLAEVLRGIQGLPIFSKDVGCVAS